MTNQNDRAKNSFNLWAELALDTALAVVVVCAIAALCWGILVVCSK